MPECMQQKSTCMTTTVRELQLHNYFTATYVSILSPVLCQTCNQTKSCVKFHVHIIHKLSKSTTFDPCKALTENTRCHEKPAKTWGNSNRKGSGKLVDYLKYKRLPRNKKQLAHNLLLPSTDCDGGRERGRRGEKYQHGISQKYQNVQEKIQNRKFTAVRLHALPFLTVQCVKATRNASSKDH